MTSPLSKTGSYGNIESESWLREEVAKGDKKIEKLWKERIDIDRVTVENHSMLVSLAAERKLAGEERAKILEKTEDLGTQLQQIRKTDRVMRSQTEMSNMICKVIAGIFIIALITGAVIIFTL